MNWIMLAILFLMAVVGFSGFLAAGRLTIAWRSLRRGRLFDQLHDQRGFTKLLAVPLVAWCLLFLIVLVMLMFVSAVSLMYVFGLIHGEYFMLLDSFAKTAGNIVVHLIYPLQVFLLTLVTFLTAVGGFQVVFGPSESLARYRLRVDGVGEYARKLAALIALATGLEAVKILFFSLLVEPSELASFFARDALPKAEPLGAALLSAALLAAVVAWWRRGKEDA